MLKDDENLNEEISKIVKAGLKFAVINKALKINDLDKIEDIASIMAH
jgi:hypothetical protein